MAATPIFDSFRGRQAFLRNVFSGYPNFEAIERRLRDVNLEIEPETVASSVVTHLKDAEAAPDVPALALLLQALEPKVSAAQRKKLAEVREYMGWGPAYPAPALTGRWLDERKPEDIVREKIIGENTLRHIHYLRRALIAADAVVRVDLGGDPIGTGFMIAPDLMVTNHHVISDAKQAGRVRVWFFDEVHHDDSPGSARPRLQAGVDSLDPLPYTSAQGELDISVVRLQAAPPLARYLPLRPVEVRQNDRVAIIQHPGGNAKKIAMQNNLVAAADARIVQYYASTEAGSSGSPVFDDNFAVVAVHLGFTDQAGRVDGDLESRNVGTSAVAFVDDLRRNAPGLLERLTILED